jgi:type VI secretion system protein ImpH
MAGAIHGWQRSSSVRDWLVDEPFKFEFYQAVRLLEAFQPLALLPGETHQPAREAVRFRSAVDFDFPASEIEKLDWSNGTPRLTVNFFGLAGALGPLPQAYTEMLLEALAKKDPAAIDFLDIFNNRLIMLLYRARQIHQPALTARSPDLGATAGHLFSCIGLGIPVVKRSLGFPASSLLQYSGLFARSIRTAAGLESLLSDYFCVAVRVHQFVGMWREIDRSQWTTLGLSGQNNLLGSQTALGKRAWDQAGCILVTMGPLDLPAFSSFLPGTPKFQLLSKLLRFYLGIGRQARARLVLKNTGVPQSRLGRSRLGLTSFLLAHAKTHDNRQVTFRLNG